MPNIFAHNHIAAQVHGPENVDAMLGSTLPDFATMYDARYAHLYGKATLYFASDGIKAGVDFHKATDRVFDGQPEFPMMTAPLREDLMAAGIPYKAARMTTALATDILVDRALLDIDAARRNFDTLRQLAMQDKLPIEDSLNHILTLAVRKYFTAYVPADYQNPDNIARIAYRQLAARGNDLDRRLTRPQLPAVAEVIGEHADRIGELGLRAVFGTIQDLGAPVKHPRIKNRQLRRFSRRVKQATIRERALQEARLKKGETVELRNPN